MNLVILDGTSNDSSVGDKLTEQAESRGLTVVRFALAGLRLAPCLGDFECWIRTPGICRTRDEGQEIARAMHDASLVVFVTPLVFGGYSADLKKAVDRLIGLVQPHFAERDGTTRHVARYARYAPILFIGFGGQKNDESVEIFREMAAGNAANLLAPAYYIHLVSPDSTHWQAELGEMLNRALDGLPGLPSIAPTADALQKACVADRYDAADECAPGSIAIFIGSARPKGCSTSESLARQLMKGLEKSNIRISLVFASQFIKSGAQAEDGLNTMLAADLLIVAAPLYVDGLPSLVTCALEKLASRLLSEKYPLRKVAGLLNCGYPEAEHNRIAMRLLRNFSHESGLTWAGGLALGGGEIIHGRPLSSLRFMVRRPIRALQLAASSLAEGQPIPVAASRLMARPLVPALIFRWAARIRWILQARVYGINSRQLLARPHDAI